MTLLDAAAALGEDHDEDDDCGIETLVVFLGANNALRTVTDLTVGWSGDGLQGPAQEGQVHGVAAGALHRRAGRARAGGASGSRPGT